MKSPTRSSRASLLTLGVAIPIGLVLLLVLALSAQPGYAAPAPANPQAPTAPTISINDVTITEGSSGFVSAVFTVTLSEAPASPVSVNYSTADGTALVSDLDYQNTSGTLNFAIGETQKPVNVTIGIDTKDEVDETFTVNLDTPVNATIADGTGDGVIDDDDGPNMSINNVSLTEGNTGTANLVFAVTLSASSVQQITVQYATADGTATAGADYIAKSGTLTFTTGTTTQNITIQVYGDTLDEANETFSVALSNVVDATIVTGNGTGTINDNDPLPVFSISPNNVNPVSLTEGVDFQTVFTVTLNVPSGRQTSVQYRTQGISATGGKDFTIIPATTLIFAPGETTKTVVVNILNDIVFENTETFNVILQNPTNATIAGAPNNKGMVSIIDDDPMPTVSIANPAPKLENNTTIQFTVQLSGPTGKNTVINYATSTGVGPGYATAGSDYTHKTGSVTISGDNSSATFLVTIKEDSSDELDEVFTVTLTSATNAIIVDNTALGTIDDDDGPTISIGNAAVLEGDSGTVNAVFTVTLSATSPQTVTVKYNTQSGTATSPDDFIAIPASPPTTVSIAPGLTQQTVTVVVNGDTLDEIDHSFNVVLSAPVDGTILDATGVGTIDDDDGPALSVGNVTVTEGFTGTVNAIFNVTLTAKSKQPVSVSYNLVGVTATADVDYVSATGVVTFTTNQTLRTITVAVKGDALDEPDETFQVVMSNIVDAEMGDDTGVGTINDDDGPTISITDVTTAEGNSGAASAVFSVTLSVSSVQTVTVNYATSNSSATAGLDYIASSGALSFAPEVVSQSVSITVTGDILDEIDEIYRVNLSAAVDASIADGIGQGTIDDDDGPGISIGNTLVTEGDSGTANANFTVSLSATSPQTITVNYATQNASAIAPGDFISATGTVTFPIGSTSQMVTVLVNGDLTDETDETFDVVLSNPVNASLADSTGTASIDDDDGVDLSISDATVTEGNAGTVNAVFSVTLADPSPQVVSVDYDTQNVDAIAAGDYISATGTLTFPISITSQTITITVNADLVDEVDETFLVVLSNAVNAPIQDGTGVGTINDDDGPVVNIADASITEGDAGSVNASFVVTLSATSPQTVFVQYSTSDGSAVAGSDYAQSSGTVSFPSGTISNTIQAPVLGDLSDEVTEAFTVTLSAPVDASIGDGIGVGSIVDNDDPPQISITDVTVTEGDSGVVSAVFTATLSMVSGKTVTVDYNTQDGTAIELIDYYPEPSGNLTFSPGQTSKSVTVFLIVDTTDEVDKTFSVALSGASNATILDNTGVATIDDDDGPQISVGDITKIEGDGGTTNAVFSVQLSATSPQTVTVSYTVEDVSAVDGLDYLGSTGSLAFAPGTTLLPINIAIQGDTTDEIDETFNLILSNPVDGFILDGSGTATIDDDDGPMISVNDASVVEGNVGTANAVFTVTLSATSPQTVTVSFATSNITATAGLDYAAVSNTLVFSPGQLQKTVAVQVNGDTADEVFETFGLNLSSPVEGVIDDGAGVGTILDDDDPTISISDVSILEEDSGFLAVTFTVTLSAPSPETVTVDFATNNGTATAGLDYEAETGSITFASGETVKTVTILIMGDTAYEADETFFLVLSNASKAVLVDTQGQATILNDDFYVYLPLIRRT